MSDTVEILENPEKSSNDKNSYRVIRLNNGLKALLVSDPNEQSKIPAVNEKEEKLSAICVCVEVGSFSDPRDVQGMAHFLGNFIKSNLYIIITFKINSFDFVHLKNI